MPGRRNITRPASLRSRPTIPNRTQTTGNEYAHQSSYLDNQQLQNDDSNPFQAMANPPKLSSMSGIVFEIFFLCYLLVAMLAQYIYIFKTVWWYPSTLPPSNNTINFHLIDKNLTTFLIFLFSHRLLWTLLWDYLKPSSENLLYFILWIVSCSVVFGVWIIQLCSYALILLDHIKFYKLLFLLYPLLLWIPYNLFIEEGYLKSFPSLFRKKPTKQRILPALKLASMLNSNREAKRDFDPDQVREDVRELCKDFNSRFAEIVFYSLAYSYYAGLVPMFFTKSYHSYDLRWSIQHTVLLLANTFLMLASFLLPSQYLQTLSKSAMLLGGYKQVYDPVKVLNSDTPVHDWSPLIVFPKGTYVKYQSKTYEACGKHNTAFPDDKTHAKFFMLFHEPLKMINWQLATLLVVIVGQIHIIVWSSQWDHIIAPAILQFFSYYILKTILRDRIILSTFYNLKRDV